MIEYPSKVSLSRYIADIFRYRQLLVLLSTKWVKLKYEHSYIGIGWIIINPIITTLVYTIFFGLAFDVDVNRLKSVSYTHLDVYKRQPAYNTWQYRFLQKRHYCL